MTNDVSRLCSKHAQSSPSASCSSWAITSTEFCVSCGGLEDCGGGDDLPARGPGKAGDLCAGEDDGNKTSETTYQSPKKLTLLIQKRTVDNTCST